jgi:hypothetical protein
MGTVDDLSFLPTLPPLLPFVVFAIALNLVERMRRR